MKPSVASRITSFRLLHWVGAAGGMLFSAIGALGLPGTISTTLSPSGNVVTGTVLTVTLRMSNYTEGAPIDRFGFVVEFDEKLYEYVPNSIVLNDQPGPDENWLRKPLQEEAGLEPILRNGTEVSSPYVFASVQDDRFTPGGTVAGSGFLLSFQLRAIGVGQAEFRLHSPNLWDPFGFFAGTPEAIGASNSVVHATAPIIVQPPTNQTATVGSSVGFSVTATGTMPFFYQWRRNGQPLVNSGRLLGVATRQLSISNLQFGDAGSYSVLVSNIAGTTLSPPAQLTVLPGIVPPSFSVQPMSTTVGTGQVATFMVAAQGSPAPALQWQRDGVQLMDGGRISGSQTPALTLANIQLADAGGFACVATNIGGRTTSMVARLEVCTSPIILTNPLSQVSPLLATVGFSVLVGGTPAPAVQWFRNDEPIAGATNALLLVSNAHRATVGLYRAVAANACGSATSSVAELQVCVTLISPILRGIMATDLFDDGGGGGGGGGAGGAPLLWRPATAVSTLPFHGVPLLYTTYGATGVVSCGVITGYHCKYVRYPHARSNQVVRATAHAADFPTLLVVTDRTPARNILACASANGADGRSSTVQFPAVWLNSYNVWAGGVGTNRGAVRLQIGDAFQNLQRTAEGFFTFEVAGDVSSANVGFTYTLSTTGLVETTLSTWAHAVTIFPQTNDWVCAYTNPAPLVDLERFYGLRGATSIPPVLGRRPSGECLTNKIPTLPQCGCHGLFLPP